MASHETDLEAIGVTFQVSPLDVTIDIQLRSIPFDKLSLRLTVPDLISLLGKCELELSLQCKHFLLLLERSGHMQSYMKKIIIDDPPVPL